MYTKIFTVTSSDKPLEASIKELAEQVNEWVRSVNSEYKIMNISSPTVFEDVVVITVVYVER